MGEFLIILSSCVARGCYLLAYQPTRNRKGGKARPLKANTEAAKPGGRSSGRSRNPIRAKEELRGDTGVQLPHKFLP